MAKKKLTFRTYALGAIGVACLARGLWRPFRQPMDHSETVTCEKLDECDNDLKLVSTAGTSNVYSLGSGQATVSDDCICIIPKNEAVVLRYELPPNAVRLIGSGKVGLGQRIATSDSVTFSVWRINQDGTYTPLATSAWLVSRGMKVANSGAGWCMTGRRLIIPPMQGDCKVRLPAPGSISVLPVSVQMS